MVWKEISLKFYSWWSLALGVAIAATWLAPVCEHHRHGRAEQRAGALDAQNAAEISFTVWRVAVGNSTAGNPVHPDADRVFMRQFGGSLAIEVQKFNGRTAHCSISDTVIYHFDAELPDPITLEWWTLSPDCAGPDLEVGEHTTKTMSTIHRQDDGLRQASATTDRTPFSIMAAIQEQPGQILQDVQELKSEIKSLQLHDS